MPERHTGDNIANKLQSIVSEFELDGKIDTCVHDNARNMECAGNKCLEWGAFGCFGHTLQLCIKPTRKTKKADATVFLPKDHEWELMNDLSTVLMDLSDVTTYMCSENSVSLSEVHPIVCGLMKRILKVQDSDGVIICKTKDVISDELNRRYQPYDMKAACSTPVIASLMDTRNKKLIFLSSQQRNKAEEFLEGLIDEIL
ncbi:unnamed protein product [Mytilus coruscus]|uniref:DUF659 domain-containing protein n=1 Tax=Mytilus coruscus TaxID=42192 RepID=A0A6J8CRM7_MYTCO|nr:unnamed protein product [Mytilus coruscus]